MAIKDEITMYMIEEPAIWQCKAIAWFARMIGRKVEIEYDVKLITIWGWWRKDRRVYAGYLSIKKRIWL